MVEISLACIFFDMLGLLAWDNFGRCSLYTVGFTSETFLSLYVILRVALTRFDNYKTRKSSSRWERCATGYTVPVATLTLKVVQGRCFFLSHLKGRMLLPVTD